MRHQNNQKASNFWFFSESSEVFSKFNEVMFGYCKPVKKKFIIKINTIRGGLSDVSAKTATLSSSPERYEVQTLWGQGTRHDFL